MIWHLALNWLSGHWMLALPIVLSMLVCCTPIGLPLLRWLIGTRPGVLLLAAYACMALVNWQHSAGYAQGVAATKATLQPKIDAATLRAEREARDAEYARGEAVNRVASAYERGRTDARKAVAGIVSGVAAGRYVLRDHFRCPVRSAPAPPANPGAVAGASPTAWGLSGSDVPFLVQFAGDADGVSDKLRLCFGTLHAERAVTP